MSAARHPARLAVIGGSALIFAGALAACGTEGDLERPAPLFGQAAQRQGQRQRCEGEGGLHCEAQRKRAAKARRPSGACHMVGCLPEKDGKAAL